MSPENLGHLSYVRERTYGHVFIVRCMSADRTRIAGRLSYVPDSDGPFRIAGMRYRKVGLGEQSSNAYPLISRFARDAVHLIPADAVDYVWNPFDDQPVGAMTDAAEVRHFFDELASRVAASGNGRTGLIGSRLVASSGVDAQADFDIAVGGAGAWASAARLVSDWIRRGDARLLCDKGFPEFEERRTELGVGENVMESIRQGQWWRKLRIGSHLVSLSCSTGLGSLPEEISDTSVEVPVDRSTGYVAGTAPYVATAAIADASVAGVLHLSWFLRQGFRGTARGRLAKVGGQPWLWVSRPDELELTA